MTFTLDTTPEALAAALADGMEKSIETAIRAELKDRFGEIVTKIGREMAQSLRGSVAAVYENEGEGRTLRVTLTIDGVSEPVEPPPP